MAGLVVALNPATPSDSKERVAELFDNYGLHVVFDHTDGEPRNVTPHLKKCRSVFAEPLRAKAAALLPALAPTTGRATPARQARRPK